ncbi:hypothetical protein RCG24_20600 [Neobacillus sp. OS1-32]|uniref:hypothetical protein n=1 Tax=Neobacillus sp. OS1-32 TaxID=3070682 RepID=UPI0027E199AD|nr:hypothetical protein [Neobacillus sp. OS1-32]WML30250.1 hypothetical protein RCG24_20600 [Neobacillus sp. OS1-32]
MDKKAERKEARKRRDQERKRNRRDKETYGFTMDAIIGEEQTDKLRQVVRS